MVQNQYVLTILVEILLHRMHFYQDHAICVNFVLIQLKALEVVQDDEEETDSGL